MPSSEEEDASASLARETKGMNKKEFIDQMVIYGQSLLNEKPTMKDLKEGPPLLCPICDRPNYFPSDHHMVPKSRGGKTTETICEDCHKAIHAHFTNKELEETYHTPEALLSHEGFAKQIKFLSKQDPGGRSKTKKNKDRLRRE